MSDYEIGEKTAREISEELRVLRSRIGILTLKHIKLVAMVYDRDSKIKDLEAELERCK